MKLKQNAEPAEQHAESMHYRNMCAILRNFPVPCFHVSCVCSIP